MSKIRGNERAEMRRILKEYRVISAKEISKKVEETLVTDHQRNKMASNKYIECPNCKSYSISYDSKIKAKEVVCPNCNFRVKNPESLGAVGSFMASTERDLDKEK